MIQRYAATFRLGLMAADAIVALIALIGASFVRFGPAPGALSQASVATPDPVTAVAVFILGWICVLWLHGLYFQRARWTVWRELQDVLRASITFAVVVLALLYAFKLPDVSRLLLVFVFPLMAAAAFGMRVALRLFLGFLRRNGHNVRYVLVLGANARAKAFADLVESHHELGLVVIGHLKADASDNGVELNRPLLGSIEGLEAILHTRPVDEVAICLPFAMEELIEQAAHLCEDEGKIVRIPVAPVERVLAQGRLESIGGISVYSVANGPDYAAALLVKRALDVVAAATLLLVLSPLFVLLAALVRLDSKGDVLFRQERVGLHGRPFRVFKFRSMCRDAEQRLERLREQNVIQGHAFKMECDPRVTRLGRFLRRTSLDELPQLWNVLRGEMSLVGPRPPLPSEVAQYDVWHRRRLSMKPGMTGLWQIGARRDPEFDRWVEKDLEYIDSWSLWLDVKIMARTVPAMLQGR